MINIYICEDNENQRQQIVKTIKNYIFIEELAMKISLETGNPYEILKHIDKEQVNLYFLDINLGFEMNGVELANKIREIDARCSIVFITTHAELMSTTFDYGIEALGFILKGDLDIMKRKIVNYLEIANKRLLLNNNHRKRIIIKVESRNINELLDDIMFFEISRVGSKKIDMYATNKKLTFSGNLNEIEKLDQAFFRCSRECLVNINNVKEVNSVTGEIRMVNGECCFANKKGIKQLTKLLDKINQENGN